MKNSNNLNELQKKIVALKKQKNAVILAHYYQTMDIQIIADFVGDSFDLSKKAKNAEENLILFCGVKFMAESAKLLSPNKKVLLPNPNAGCPMADMINPETIKNLRKKHPKAAVVCYVNSSAETKAECDICCTSSNAVNIVRKLDAGEIIFVPDKNLGFYVSKFVPEKKFIYIDGYCPIHKNITAEEVLAKKQKYPNAKFAVHPECESDVVNLADFAGSTSQILDYCINSRDWEFIIGTESGVVERLRYYHPEKKYYILSPKFVCQDMKKTTLEDVYNCLANDCRGDYQSPANIIELPEDIINKANIPLEKMLLLG